MREEVSESGVVLFIINIGPDVGYEISIVLEFRYLLA